MFSKIGAQNSFANFTGKHFCWSLFLKNLQTEAFLLYWKKTPTQVFFREVREVCKIFRKTFVYRTPLETASAPPVAASVFFLKNN